MMNATRRVISILFLPFVAANSLRAADAGATSFNRDIRPILSDNCFACHGLDEKHRKADLRLDVETDELDLSELLARINSTDEDEVMPPPDSNKSLTAVQKATIKRWADQGAKYEKHWAFIAPVKSEITAAAGAATPNPIDAFLQARLADEGLKPAGVANRETLIRRVTLDLTGLPPTPAEVDAFLADESPDAYEKLVEGLMKRVSHGEHMARYWLDQARYADTHGMHLDNERSMWPYRDWVVRAFNENLPFDEFTRWQLAGDLLAEPTQDQLIASGFNRCNVTTGEGGSIAEEWIYRYAVDRTSTTVEVWMGLTAGCAVCHDHKFDPISTKEYYSLYSFFHSAADPAMDGNKVDTPPILKLEMPELDARLKTIDEQITAVDKRIVAEMAKLEYTDPATLNPAPAVVETEVVWFEDGFQPGGRIIAVGKPLQLVESLVFSGKLAIKRAAAGLEQDVLQGGVSFDVPANGKIFAHCFLDPASPPETIMIQFHTKGWNHRAVWGAEAKIPWGKPDTAEKVLMGALPKTGEWVRLEVDAAKLGLTPGTKVTGYAFTQFGGTVSWDKLGVRATTDKTKDPGWSYAFWQQQSQGKQIAELPTALQPVVKDKKVEQWSESEVKQIHEAWLVDFYLGARDLLGPLAAEKAPLEAEKAKIEEQRPITFVMADLPTPRESFVMIRGAYDKPGEKVSRGVPGFLPPLPEKPKDGDYNRLDLANWLVRPDHPLTSRVEVNRIWQQFFGIGLVSTSTDFGSQGEPPSHPELLDWLAVQLVEDGWDVQKLVKRIVTSHAYRQSSKVTPELIERDPENRLLARGPRFRLDAEVLRDQALFVSGLLVPTVGGKGVNPYQPPNIWEPVAFGGSNTRYYKQGAGADLYRRSLYTFLKRTAPPPFMASFDAPNREQSCAVRSRSNTPLQALQLMNDIQHVEAARNFASRMMTEGGATPEQRIAWGWRVVTARIADPDELQIAHNAFDQHRNRYASDAPAAAELIGYGESKADPKLDPAELAAYTLVANLILNLDESLNKN